MELVYLGLIGVICGGINTVAGGGSLLAIPALMFFGLPPHVANASNRVGVLLQSLVAAWKFSKTGHLSLKSSWKIILVASLGAFWGARISLKIDESLMRQIIGMIMFVILAVMIFNPKSWLSQSHRKQWPLFVQYMIFIIIGLYGGFLQAGVGIFIITGLLLSSGMNLLQANACKSAMVASFTVPAVIVFAWNGVIDWSSSIALGLGSALGSWLGSFLVLSHGAKLVRYVLIVVVIVAATKLLLT